MAMGGTPAWVRRLWQAGRSDEWFEAGDGRQGRWGPLCWAWRMGIGDGQVRADEVGELLEKVRRLVAAGRVWWVVVWQEDDGMDREEFDGWLVCDALAYHAMRTNIGFAQAEAREEQNRKEGWWD